MLEDQGVGDDEHQHDGQLARIQQGFPGIRMSPDRQQSRRTLHQTGIITICTFQRPHVPIDKIGNQKGIDSGNSSRFSRCEDTAINAAHDNDN